MPNVRKLTIFLLVIFSSLFLFLSLGKRSALADVPLDRDQWNQAVGDTNSSYTLEDNNQQVFTNLLHSARDSMLGNETVAGQTGALNSMGGFIATMITEPPASTNEYLADLGSSLGISTKEAYAQGTGWKALSPVLEVWKAFRNIAYLGFVIIFIVVGFMIMFRAKLDAQTVVTVQAALPKIVITLLVITFSYAIAGLMIDLIYITIYLAVGVFSLSGLIVDGGKVIDRLLERNLFEIMFHGRDIFSAGPGAAVDDMIKGFFGGEESGILSAAAGWLGGQIFFEVIIAVALVFVVFKLFITLLLSYVGIVVQVIFAPITLLFNALPNSNSLGNWLKGLLANIAPFPVVAIMFLLAAVFIGAEPGYGGSCSDTNPWCIEENIGYLPTINNPNQEAWVPPFLSLKGGTGGTNPITALIGLGIVMMTPTIVGKIKKMFQVEGSGFGGAIAGGLLGPISGAGQLGMTALSLGSSITSIRGARSQRPSPGADISAVLERKAPPSAGGEEG